MRSRTIGFAALLMLALAVMPAYGAKPLIGISSAYSKSSVRLGDTYCIAVEKAGGIPVVLPLVHSDEDAEGLVARIDGLIVSGGEDVNPQYYGETVLNETVYCNFVRDSSDMRIVKAAMKRRIPIMGICRGMQLINVFMGGTLFQDIPTQAASGIMHKQPQPASEPTHDIRIVGKSSVLARACGERTVKVNSKHHQSVRKTGKGLKVTAKADDGIIEGVEGDNIVCVQFHPESLVKAGHDSWIPLFRDLVVKSSSATGK